MKITKEILAELEDDLKTAEICRPNYSDLITEIFIAYSHLPPPSTVERITAEPS